MNCVAGLLNFILYCVNVVFLVVGILLIVLGSIMISHITSYASNADQLWNTDAIPICVLVLGCLIFIVSFIGCCGVWRQSACMTGTYSLMMFLLFVLQLVLTCWVAVNRDSFLQDMSQLVNTIWTETLNSSDNMPMGALELTFDCCGDSGYQDYSNTQIVPGTCCGYTNANAACPASIYTMRPGCNAKFVSFWSDNTNLIRWAGLGICIYEFIVFFLAGILAKCMRDGRGRNIS